MSLHLDRRARGWLLVAAVGLVVLGLALTLASRLDARVADALAGAGALATDASVVLAGIGDAAVVVPVAIVLGAYFTWRKRYWLAARVVVLIGGAEATVLVLKEIVRRPRPPNPYETGFGFPSGHATAATVVACLLVWYALSIARPRARAVGLFAVGALWALLIAWSRLVLGVHRFSDIVGGVGAGLLVAGVGLVVAELAERRWPAPKV